MQMPVKVYHISLADMPKIEKRFCCLGDYDGVLFVNRCCLLESSAHELLGAALFLVLFYQRDGWRFSHVQQAPGVTVLLHPVHDLQGPVLANETPLPQWLKESVLRAVECLFVLCCLSHWHSLLICDHFHVSLVLHKIPSLEDTVDFLSCNNLCVMHTMLRVKVTWRQGRHLMRCPALPLRGPVPMSRSKIHSGALF